MPNGADAEGREMSSGAKQRKARCTLRARQWSRSRSGSRKRTHCRPPSKSGLQRLNPLLFRNDLAAFCAPFGISRRLAFDGSCDRPVLRRCVRPACWSMTGRGFEAMRRPRWSTLADSRRVCPC